MKPEDVVERRYLQIGPWTFRCPYCGQNWDRGGGKEGFVKAAASNHVASCYEIVLFLAGYVVKPISRGSGWAPILVAPSEADPRVVRMIKATLRRRRKAGFEPKTPAA